MHIATPVRGPSVITALLAIALILSGCCGITENGHTNQTNGTNQTNVTPPVVENRPPEVDLTLNSTSGPSPFYPRFTYSCYEPDGNMASCEMMIDGQTFAKAFGNDPLFQENYTYPDFYYEAVKMPGNHTLSIEAVDTEGLTASKTAEFTVLPGNWLEGPGWYNCNENRYSPPCDYMYNEYCNKIVPEDIKVREAAAEAIAKHPGQFSLNQLLDVYDWVHANVFYQNVPFDKWPPYPPNETLRTRSGDCKNQAVLIASMVESIGGSARILYIPECQHAFSEVYLGTGQDVNALSNAVWAHYNVVEGTYPTWHTSLNKENQTENWFIFDTAGGYYPGNTIQNCMNATTVYYLLDCNREADELNAPISGGTEYGPLTRLNESIIMRPGYYAYYYIPPWLSTVPDYEWCHYKVRIRSVSTKSFDWYLTDERGYEDYADGRSFRYQYGEEGVMQTEYEFNWNEPKDIYIITINPSSKSSVTIKEEVIETCYKGYEDE